MTLNPMGIEEKNELVLQSQLDILFLLPFTYYRSLIYFLFHEYFSALFSTDVVWVLKP